jgi:hypothetical protein
MGVRQTKELERELREILSLGLVLKGLDPNDLQAQGWSITTVRNMRELAQDLVERMLGEPEGA